MEVMQLDQKMTDQFLHIFFSQEEVEVAIYLLDSQIWRWPGDLASVPCYLMSPKMHSTYLAWIDTLSPLLKELK